MSYYNTVKLIVNIFLLLIVLFVLIWFVKETRVSRLNKRLNKYTISSNNRHSLFDIALNTFLNFRGAVNKFLSKSAYLKKYSLKYEKYIDKKSQFIFGNAMDFVSTKFTLSIIFLFFLLVSTVSQNNELTISKIIIAFSLGFFSLDIFLLSRNKIILYEMKNDLLKAITIMNNCFKSGRSIVQSIEIVGNEIDGPLKQEFLRMRDDLSYGLELDAVFERFNERVNLKDVKYITTSLTILNKTGGNIVDVFSSIEKTIFNNKKLEDELKNLSAASKALYHTLSIVPFVFVIVLYVLDPTYFMPLFINPLGLFIVFLIIVIYIVYIIIVKKIIKLKEY